MPVTFQALVHGVKAFWLAKSRAGSASSRSSPTFAGGRPRVGVRTTSYGARAASAAGGVLAQPADGEAELGAAHGVAETAEPAGQRAQPVLATGRGRRTAR